MPADARNQQAGQMTEGRAYPGGWPNFPQPNYYPGRQITESRDDYANRVVVERREHDATIGFFRDGKSSGSAVATVTVPLAVLDALAAEEKP